MRPMRSTRLYAFVAIVVAIVFCGAAFAQTRVIQQVNNPHNPYTMKGFLVRGELHIPIEDALSANIQDMGPALFQEIAPCTLASTLTADHFAAPWGGPKLNAFESRTYAARGYLSAGDFVNPCSGAIPSEARALDIRVHAVNPDSGGTLALSWGPTLPVAGIRALDYPTAAANAMEEAGVMLDPNGSFTLHTTAATDVVVEVLGYFLPDPAQAKPVTTGYEIWYVTGELFRETFAECVNNGVPPGSSVIGCEVEATANYITTLRPVLQCTGTIVNNCLNVEGPSYSRYRVTIVSPTAP